MSDLLLLAVLKNFEVSRVQTTHMLAVRVGDNRIHLDKVHIEVKRMRQYSRGAAR